MSKSNVFVKYTVLVGVLFFVPLFLIFFFGRFLEQHFYTLPYYDPALPVVTNYKYFPPVDSFPDPAQFHQIPDFDLTSHRGTKFTRDSLGEKVWIVAFFSTNSDNVVDATRRLLEINFKLEDLDGFGILCLTLDPEFDTPDVLSRYVDEVEPYRMGEERWYFLTGEEQEISSLIKEGFLIHEQSNIATFWLMDPFHNLRGRYNANDPGTAKEAYDDVLLLKKELDFRKLDDK